jgi:hypothetical protein
MNSNNTSGSVLLQEMRVLNELRKLKPEQRKELIETLEREEKLEEDALKKNPNLHVESKLQQVLNELKDLRVEVHLLKAKSSVCTLNLDNFATNSLCNNINSNACSRNRCFETDSSDLEIESGECGLLSIDWWPIIIFVFIFLALLSLPSGGISGVKGCRPSPFLI